MLGDCPKGGDYAVCVGRGRNEQLPPARGSDGSCANQGRNSSQERLHLSGMRMDKCSEFETRAKGGVVGVTSQRKKREREIKMGMFRPKAAHWC